MNATIRSIDAHATGPEGGRDGWTPSRFSHEAWVRARLGWRALKAEEYVNEGFALLSTPDIKGATIEFDKVNFITKERYSESPEIQLRIGDVLLAKDGSTLGTVNVVRELPRPTTVNSSIAVITPGPRLDPIFLYYSLQGAVLKSRIAEYRAGMGVPHLFQDDIRRFPLKVPRIGLQRLIGAYLDAHTAKIDVLVEKQECLIQTLAERRQAVISHAVTKGIDPNAGMKDSGVEWLGAIPRTWTASRLKHVSDVQTGLTLGKAVRPDEAIELPYLRVANVQTNGVNLDEIKTVLVDRSEWAKYRLRDGDVLMTEGGDIDKLGRGCLWNNQIDPCVHQNHVFAVRCSPELDSRMLVYILAAGVARSYFQMTAKRATNLASTNSTTLGNLPIALPDTIDQERIVEYLDGETAMMDALSAKAREMINVLKERRQALISAAVTGKIDVRGLS
jgi:type I restriction enzyme S subunit